MPQCKVYPIKALLSASGKYVEASKKFADIGIEVSGLQVNLTQMLSKKIRLFLNSRKVSNSYLKRTKWNGYLERPSLDLIQKWSYV